MMDFDDRAWRWLMGFGGVALAALGHQLAGWLGWDIALSLKKLFRKKRKHGHH